MKSYFNLSRVAFFSAVALLIAQLAGCGQTGPLFLPKKPGEAAPPASSVVTPSPIPTAPTNTTTNITPK